MGKPFLRGSTWETTLCISVLGTSPTLELARKQNKRRMKEAGRYLIKFHEGVTKVAENCKVRPEESG